MSIEIKSDILVKELNQGIVPLGVPKAYQYDAALVEAARAAVNQGLDDVAEAGETAVTSVQAQESTSTANINNLGDKILAQMKHGYGYPFTAATVAGMTDTAKIYVYTGSETSYTNGNWYYWNGTAWTSGGVYNATALETDKTLTVSGAAADAQITGYCWTQANLADEYPVVENLSLETVVNKGNCASSIKYEGNKLLLISESTSGNVNWFFSGFRLREIEYDNTVDLLAIGFSNDWILLIKISDPSIYLTTITGHDPSNYNHYLTSINDYSNYAVLRAEYKNGMYRICGLNSNNGYDIVVNWFNPYDVFESSDAKKICKTIVPAFGITDAGSGKLKAIRMINTSEYINQWIGKKMYVFGDSITAMGYYEKSLSNELKVASYKSYGHAGYGYVDLATVYTEMISEAQSSGVNPDLITLFAGTNDFGKSYSIDSMISGMRSIIDNLYVAFPKVTLVIFAPLKRYYTALDPSTETTNLGPNQLGKYLIEYVKAIIDVANEYSIPILNFYNDGGINSKNYSVKTTDGLHPTEDYAYCLGHMMASFVKNIKPL